jgi:hypothetical protein
MTHQRRHRRPSRTKKKLRGGGMDDEPEPEPDTPGVLGTIQNVVKNELMAFIPGDIAGFKSQLSELKVDGEAIQFLEKHGNRFMKNTIIGMDRTTIRSGQHDLYGYFYQGESVIGDSDTQEIRDIVSDIEAIRRCMDNAYTSMRGMSTTIQNHIRTQIQEKADSTLKSYLTKLTNMHNSVQTSANEVEGHYWSGGVLRRNGVASL